MNNPVFLMTLQDMMGDDGEDGPVLPDRIVGSGSGLV